MIASIGLRRHRLRLPQRRPASASSCSSPRSGRRCGPAADHALTERDSAAPTDAYGRSKLAAEDAVRSRGRSLHDPAAGCALGRGAKGNVGSCCGRRARRGRFPSKDFVNRRSLLGIDNFTSALSFVLTAPAAIGETYVVCRSGNSAAALRRRRNPARGAGPPAAVFAVAAALCRNTAASDGPRRFLGALWRQSPRRPAQAHRRRLAAGPRHADRAREDGSRQQRKTATSSLSAQPIPLRRLPHRKRPINRRYDLTDR